MKQRNKEILAPFILPLFRSVLFIMAGLLFVLISKKSLEQASQ